ncbi:MAG: hypothetical protein QM682_12040 [Paracoccus sp. (in: a-proteobacteria)]
MKFVMPAGASEIPGSGIVFLAGYIPDDIISVSAENRIGSPIAQKSVVTIAAKDIIVAPAAIQAIISA